MQEFFSEIFAYHPESPLFFSRLGFWLFFALVVLIYSFLYKNKRTRNVYLFAISLFFYYKSGGWFFFLLIFSTLVDYFAGIQIFRSRHKPTRKKMFLLLSLFANLGVLAYFKYSYFFIDLINQIAGTQFQVIDLFSSMINGLSGANLDAANIILPVGISFFTFQTISYTVDVYRGKVLPVRNILDFGFYVSFFPQLVAGPIVRASGFVPQLYQPYKLSKNEAWHAIYLIIGGLIKKLVVSDFIALHFVDRVFSNPGIYSGLENLMSVYGYAIQIYCDFSGYTDMAIGLALLLGFRLPLNFNSPYKAVNLSDFWRRWHISLSSWLRDYLYIPLGGNRKGKLRKNINLMLTMLLGGLWHGANWRFVIWGGLHGIGLMISKAIESIIPNKKPNTLHRFIGIFLSFHFVCLTWVFFRADSMDASLLMLTKIVSELRMALLPRLIMTYPLVFVIMIGAYILHWLPGYIKEQARGYFINLNFWLKMLIMFFVIILLYQVKSSGIQPFIYFQF